jgi:hypothetical protein
MKLTRRNALGAAIAAPFAANMPYTQSSVPQPGTPSREWNIGGGAESIEQAIPDLNYWRGRKKFAQKILAGDFSDHTLNDHIRRDYYDLIEMKSLSPAARRMISIQRSMDEAKQRLIVGAHDILAQCARILGIDLLG